MCPRKKGQPEMSDSNEQSTGRIVVGVDGSDESKAALRWAARQARLTGAELEAVISWHIPSTAYGVPMATLTSYDFAPGAEETLTHVLEEVLGEEDAKRVSTVVEEGHPALILLAEAKGADLLVLGSRGHGAFTGMLLGSVSEHCVAHAPCPVVVVRHEPT
jgi:nucleotide-binding universal stress UspA family protein